MINSNMKDTGVTISFFEKAPAHISRNAIVDDLDTWLNQYGSLIVNIEMNSPNPFELTETKVISVPMADGNAFITNPNVSYARVTYLNYHAYYFVRKLTRTSNNGVNVECELDTLNTLHNGSSSSPLLTFNGRSVIERQHVDRFVEDSSLGSASVVINSVIDRVSEGAKCELRNNYSTERLVEPRVYDSTGYVLDHDREWYLIYASESYSVGEETRQRIVCYLVPSSSGSLRTQVGLTSRSIQSMENVIRTSEKIVKIIRCPYCPDEITVEVRSGTTFLTPDKFKTANTPSGSLFFGGSDTAVFKLELGTVDGQGLDGISCFVRGLEDYKNLEHYFNRIIEAGDLDDRLDHDRYIEDPKLDSSEFHGIYYVYDSAVWQLFPELFDNTGSGIYLFPEYCQSTSVDSALTFSFEFSTGQANANYLDSEFYPALMASNRKNEVAVFSSDYMNYIRNGYNYDREKQTISEAISIGGSVVTLGASLASGNALGMIGSALSLTKSIAGSVEAEISMNKKLNELAAKAYSVSSINDSSLFAEYGKGRLKLVELTPLVEERKRWDDIFYYYGYNRAGRMGEPNVTSRVWFNYLRGEISFKYENQYPLWLIDKAKELFREGVTYFHKQVVLSANVWDLEQTKENYEKALLGL